MAIIFGLRNKLVYSNKHGISGQEALDIELIAPSYEQRIYSRGLKQIVQAAIKKTSQEEDLYRVKLLAASHVSITETAEFAAQTAEQPEPVTALEKQKDEEASIEWMRKTLIDGMPLGTFAEALEEFSANARYLVKIDEDVYLTETLIRQVDETELEEIFAAYCYNFTVPCLL